MFIPIIFWIIIIIVVINVTIIRIFFGHEVFATRILFFFYVCIGARSPYIYIYIYYVYLFLQT